MLSGHMKAQFERIPKQSDASFFVQRFETERFDHPYHYHPEIEITLITQGSGTRIIGDHVTSYGPGDLCLIGPDLPHIYYSQAEQSQMSAALVMQFQLKIFDGIFRLAELKPVSDLLERSVRGIQFGSAAVGEVSPLMKILCGSVDPTRRILGFVEILSSLSRQNRFEFLSSPGLQFVTGTQHRALIEAVCQYILEHYTDPISLEEVAIQAQMSPSAFSRFFQRQTQQSFSDFLGKLRLGQASQMLLQSDRSIAEVCFASGFGNLSNFNRRFKARYKMTPREWQKHHVALG